MKEASVVQLSLPKNSAMTEGKTFTAASGATRVKTFRVTAGAQTTRTPVSALYEVDLDTWVLDMLRTRSYVTTGSAQEQR